MQPRSVSLGGMFGWIADTFQLVFSRLGTMLGASFLTLVLGFALVIPMMVVMMFSMPSAAEIQAGAMGGMQLPMMFWVSYAATILISLVVFPPLVIGWFRLGNAADQGNSPGAMEIVRPYMDGDTWKRSVVYALLAMVIYIAVMGLLFLAFAGAFMQYMQEATAMQMAAMTGGTPTMPTISFALVIGYFVTMFVAIMLQFIFMVGFCQVAMRGESPMASLVLAAKAVLRNVVMLVVFLFLMFIAFIIFAIILGIVMGIVMAVAGMVHPVLAMVAMLALYVPLLLCMYPLMFVGFYHVWKSMLGGDAPAADGQYA